MSKKWLFALCLGLLGGCGGEDWGLDQHGRTVTDGSLSGRWLVINYWAEWCAPCRKEVPELNHLSASLPADRARVLGVNFDALQGEELATAVRALGIDYTNLASDPAARLGLERSAVLPVTWLVDPQGRVRERLNGEQEAEQLKARLRALGAGL